MDLTFIFLLGGIFFLFLVYFLFDVNYFVRFWFTIVMGKFFRTKLKFLDTSVVYGIVFLPDADHYLTHMNNARAVREFDFGRMDYVVRTGLIKHIIDSKGGGVVAAQTFRYRRPLHMFTTYKILTTPVYFDARSIYFEQRIVTLSDGMTRVVGYIKLTFNSHFNIEKIVSKYYRGTVKPSPPKDLEHWIEFNELSSLRLKSKKPSKKFNDEVSETTQLSEETLLKEEK